MVWTLVSLSARALSLRFVWIVEVRKKNRHNQRRSLFSRSRPAHWQPSALRTVSGHLGRLSLRSTGTEPAGIVTIEHLDGDGSKITAGISSDG